MSFSFLQKNNTNKTYAVFCISTSSVTLTITKKSEPVEEVLLVSRLAMELDEDPTADKLLRLANKKIIEIFNQIHKTKSFSYFTHNTEIIIMVGSPWHIGWHDEVSIDKEEAFKVSKTFIDTAINESFASVHNDLVITSINVMAYRLNGYHIPNPIDKITKSLKLDVYISSAPKLFVDTISASIKQYIPHHKLTYLPFNNCLNIALQEILPAKDFIIVSPENEVTEIVLIRGGVILSEASIPFGGATLARSLFGKESSSVQEAIAKTKRFIKGELDMSDLNTIEQKLNTAKSMFVTSFRDVVWKMNNALVLPSDLYIVSKNIASHFITDWITNEEYMSETMTSTGFQIKKIGGTDVIRANAYKNAKSSIPICVAVSSRIINQIS
jgi:hypothetical protein